MKTTALAFALLFSTCADANSVTLKEIAERNPRTTVGHEVVGAKDRSRFPGWREAVERARADTDRAAECAASRTCDAGGPLGEALAAAKSSRGLERLRKVNAIANSAPYVTDPDPRDLWRGPRELYRNGGDCEDFALAKMSVLERSGVPVENMRIVVVDHAYRAALHAVLEIDTRDGPVVLDSLSDIVLPSSDYERLYEPKWMLKPDEGAIRLRATGKGD